MNVFSHPLDGLTADLTAFNTFRELVDAAGLYRPTILPRDERHIDLADGYDAFQAARGDARRAWRGIGAERSEPILVGSPEGFYSIVLAGVPAGSGLYSEWLRVIHLINGAYKEEYPAAEQWIGSPTGSHQGVAGSYVEEYPEFRVILRHTEWGCGENSGTIQAKTLRADVALQVAVAEVRREGARS